MTSDLREHYGQLFLKHGDAAAAVQYSDGPSQSRRFDILSEFAADLGSVVDLGCGLGHFFDALKSKGFQDQYLGLDFVSEFLEHARRKHASDPTAKFKYFDMAQDSYPEGYDTFVICGVFNNRMNDNKAFMDEALEKAFSASRKGVSFNAMSTYVDFQDEGLFYRDPLELFDFCKRKLTKRVVLRHDYLVRDDRLPFEYTMYLYK